MGARDLLIKIESRRSTESSVSVGLTRMVEQREQLARRRDELEQELAGGDEPILQLESRLDDALARRLEVESELARRPPRAGRCGHRAASTGREAPDRRATGQ